MYQDMGWDRTTVSFGGGVSSYPPTFHHMGNLCGGFNAPSDLISLRAARLNFWGLPPLSRIFPIP